MGTAVVLVKLIFSYYTGHNFISQCVLIKLMCMCACKYMFVLSGSVDAVKHGRLKNY